MPLKEHHGVLPSVHPSVFLAEGAWVIGEVTIGMEGGVWFNAVIRGDINRIDIGARSNVQDCCVLHVTKALPTLIGEDVTVGHKAMLHGCRILDASLIGMNATVLDNAQVGPFAVVAAGSVVKENFVVPEGTLAAGVPARIVRELTGEERKFLLQSAQNYIGYARSFMAAEGRTS